MTTATRIQAALFAFCAMAAAIVLGPVLPAHAGADGAICFWNYVSSVGPIIVNFKNSYSGATYNASVPVGYIDGEPGCEATALTPTPHTTSEPQSFYTATGYCTRWNISTNGGFDWGSIATSRGPGWTWIYPGAGWKSPWLVRAHRYAC